MLASMGSSRGGDAIVIVISPAWGSEDMSLLSFFYRRLFLLRRSGFPLAVTTLWQQYFIVVTNFTQLTIPILSFDARSAIVPAYNVWCSWCPAAASIPRIGIITSGKRSTGYVFALIWMVITLVISLLIVVVVTFWTKWNVPNVVYVQFITGEDEFILTILFVTFHN